jgi:hypothetical protein
MNKVFATYHFALMLGQGLGEAYFNYARRFIKGDGIAMDSMRVSHYFKLLID